MAILLQANNLKKEYGGQKIFSGLSFAVSEKQKIGVIGRNGAGKSTIFKIICGEEEADDGELIIGKDTHIGYLKQNEEFEEGESAFAYLERLSEKPEWQIKKLAAKFELDQEKLGDLAEALSGGWRMRLKLTGMLLKEPNIFLLDEPSNYLDLSTILLLEDFLRSYRGSFMIISHDREFLKQTCEETLEISGTGCYHYPGGIESYLAFKEEKLSTLVKANESLNRQQQHLQEFVDRFRAKASKAKQAQAVIRKINKLENKRITIEHQAGITRINIPPVIKKKNTVLKMKNLSIGYGHKKIVENINIDFQAGERVAILGLNGQGKSTLIKTLTEKISPLGGSFHFASDSQLAYHSQEEMEKMDGKIQAGDYLRKMAASEIKTETVLKMAGDFLFKDEELKKSISVLSGGERSRLLLAGLLLSKPDILILDEPTCHLDFETTEALGSALNKYNGSVFFASHDRTFCSLVATDIIEIKEGHAKKRYEEYEEYVGRLEKELLKKPEIVEVEAPRNSATERYQQLKERQKMIRQLEKELAKLQEQKKSLLEYFLENYHDYDQEKNRELENIKTEIWQKEEEWFKLSSEQENS
ncbi:MAG: ATP-binding cassette domain-containing protein [Candidatus Falkowbacteria bacterium]|nr:ATP-binding cassette domain-containing protein [Candidatus Falkowbacteria bacterium]